MFPHLVGVGLPGRPWTRTSSLACTAPLASSGQCRVVNDAGDRKVSKDRPVPGQRVFHTLLAQRSRNRVRPASRLLWEWLFSRHQFTGTLLSRSCRHADNSPAPQWGLTMP